MFRTSVSPSFNSVSVSQCRSIYFITFSYSVGILMPEESRTEFIQFCDKFRIVTPVAQFCYAKIFNLWIFAFLLFQYKNQFYIILSDERKYYKCVLLKYRHYIYKVKMRHGNINFSATLIFCLLLCRHPRWELSPQLHFYLLN